MTAPAARIFLVAVACLGNAACAGGLVITMSRAQLQRRVEQTFPVQRDLVAATLELNEPEILLQRGLDKVGMSMTSSVRVLGGATFAGKVAILGDLSYEQATAAFYLTHPQIVELRIPDLPTALHQPVVAAANIGLVAFLRKFPVYRLKSDVERSAQMYIKSVKVSEGEVVVQMAL